MTNSGSRNGPRKFTTTETREAWLVTADNLEQVAALCDGQANHDCVITPATGLDSSGVTAVPGDYLVTWWDTYRTIPDWLFERDCVSQWTEITP